MKGEVLLMTAKEYEVDVNIMKKSTRCLVVKPKLLAVGKCGKRPNGG